LWKCAGKRGMGKSAFVVGGCVGLVGGSNTESTEFTEPKETSKSISK